MQLKYVLEWRDFRNNYGIIMFEFKSEIIVHPHFLDEYAICKPEENYKTLRDT